MIVCTSELDAGLYFVIPSEIGARRSPGDVLVFLIPCVIDGALLLYFLRGFRAPVSSNAWAGAERDLPCRRANRCEGQSLAQDIW